MTKPHALGIVLLIAAGGPQAVGQGLSNPTFEVASIKPNRSDVGRRVAVPANRRVTAARRRAVDLRSRSRTTGFDDRVHQRACRSSLIGSVERPTPD